PGWAVSRVAVTGGRGGGRRCRGDRPRAPPRIPGRPKRGTDAPRRRSGRRVGSLPARSGPAPPTGRRSPRRRPGRSRRGAQQGI
ncbi:uncharacterized protein METZ01_LOCUS220166, partial [marine metagenome]